VNDQELLRYSRHILLPQIGIEGQEMLRAARLLILGAGGLGSPAALYLASAGVGKKRSSPSNTMREQRERRTTTSGSSRPMPSTSSRASARPPCSWPV